MSVRTDVYRGWPEGLRAFTAFTELAEEGLPKRVVDLVYTRVSQLNGCAYCLDMHTREAVELGEDHRRLHTLAAWRDAPWFTADERAALALAEEVTVLTRAPSQDSIDAAVSAFGLEGFARLLWVIVTINGWNRVNVTARLLPRR